MKLTEILSYVNSVLGAGLLVSTALVILGKQGIQSLLGSLRFPQSRSLLMAVFVPVAINDSVPFARYVVDRVDWAAHNFGRFSPPQFVSYFSFENIWHPFVVLTIFAAFAEEMVFRGMLLPKLIDRYGLHRGIFFTGLSWAAMHFHSDGYPGLSVGGVLLHLASRILLCLGLNYAFAWMTLRQGSILPAAIFHATWNLLTTFPDQFGFSWEPEFRIAFLAVVAYALYRFWPIRPERYPNARPPGRGTGASCSVGRVE